MNGNKPEMRRYVRNQELEIEKSITGYIQYWIMTAADMAKKAMKEIENDIRIYFPRKSCKE